MFVFSVNAQSYQFVGSKGSDVYHYPTCTYAKNIKTENLVTFVDAQDAVSKGYSPCSKCHPPLPVSSTSPSATAKPTVTPTATPTDTTSPTPVTPEITPLAIVVGLLAVSSVVLIARKRQLGKQASDGKT
jgi:hypothetical protein